MTRNYIVTALEMKQYDNNTIEEIGIPACVLMERAALAAVEMVEKHCSSIDSGRQVLIMAATELLPGEFLRKGGIRLRYGVWEIRIKPPNNGDSRERLPGIIQ